ncbi:hypothetical protein JCM30760_22140 [Thiomicrorhabdus hydrogeniphila]
MKKIIKVLLVSTLFLGSFYNSAYAQKADFIGDIELRKVKTQDAVRILSELSGKNVIVTNDAADVEFSLFIRNASLDEAIDSMCRVTGLWYRQDADSHVYVVMTPKQFKEDVLVYRNESTKVFTLKHQNVVSAANAIKALFGNRVVLEEPVSDTSYEFDGDMNESDSSTLSTSLSTQKRMLNNYSSTSNNSASALAGEVEGLQGDLTLSALQKIGEKTALRDSDVSGLVQAAPIRVTYNSLHNLLLVRSSDQKSLKDIEKLIEKIDQPAKQVLLQMKIMRVALGENEDSVFDFQYTAGSTSGPNSASASNPLGTTSLSENVFGLGMKPDQLTAGSLVFQVANSDWLAKLAFLESENRTKLVSTPLIMASNNKEAEIFIGEERPLVENITATGGTISDGTVQPIVLSTQMTRKEVGTKLKIWPRINSDSTVTLDIEQEISRINLGAATIPVASGTGLSEYAIDTITTTNLDLTAVAKHNQTIAIGGLIEETSTDDLRKIPGLSDISFLKDIFSSTENDFARTELVILIKPFIYDSVDLHSDGIKKVKQELSFDDSIDIVNGEIVKSNDETTDIKTQLQSLDSISKQLKELVTQRDVFKSKMNIDWRHEAFLVSSLGSVEKEGHYFTRVLVTNQGLNTLPLTESTLGKYWYGQAWLFGSSENNAEIKPNESRSAILISKKPIEQVLTEENVPMRYVMGGGDL